MTSTLCVGVAVIAVTIARRLGGAPFREEADRRHDLAGRAVPALEGVVADEGLLHRMQPVPLHQTFDRCDPFVGHRAHLGDAGASRITVHQHGARATLAFATSILASGQIELIAQNAQQA